VTAAPGLAAPVEPRAGVSAPVVIAAPEKRMTALAWGLVPAWADGPSAKPQINARAESAADKPYFREAFRWRRCLVPATSWEETPRRGEKTPVRFALKPRALFAFAGLWEPKGFAVLTVEPNPVAARVHDRMPAVLDPESEAAWLDPKTPPARLRDLLAPYPSDLVELSRAATPQGELF
jgi:putative SOS response-associated peptidase YedK